MKSFAKIKITVCVNLTKKLKNTKKTCTKHVNYALLIIGFHFISFIAI